MSTRWAGRARRKFSRGTSDWPPASTFASSSVASSAQTSSADAGAWYWNGGGSNSLQHRDRAEGGRLAALEGPREAAEHDLLVQYLVDVPAAVLDMDHVVRKQIGRASCRER